MTVILLISKHVKQVGHGLPSGLGSFLHPREVGVFHAVLKLLRAALDNGHEVLGSVFSTNCLKVRQRT